MKFSFMKKNQAIVAVIGLMLIAAGYLNFVNGEGKSPSIETGSLTDSIDMAEIGDAKLVSTKPAEDNNVIENQSGTKQGEKNEVSENKVGDNTAVDNTIKGEENKDNSETEETNAQITTDEYFTKSRLERDTMHSQMIESYQKILEKTTISESQKNTAQKEITKINEQKNALMITENLIKTKGFEDLIIFINDKSVNVVVKAKKLDTKQIAQIQNIITRELKADISNIHITNKE